MTETQDPVVTIPLELLKHENPLDGRDYWADDVNPLTKQDITDAIRDGRLDPAPKTLKKSPTDYGTKFHAERIAWFVVNSWQDPIFLDFGVPTLGNIPPDLVVDGAHRLAAAFYRGDSCIDVTWAGDRESFLKFLNQENF